MKSIERPKGRGLVRRVYGGLVCLLPASGWFTSLWMVYQPLDGLPAFYQPFTSLLPAFGWLAGWLVGWLAGWLAD